MVHTVGVTYGIRDAKSSMRMLKWSDVYGHILGSITYRNLTILTGYSCLLLSLWRTHLRGLLWKSQKNDHDIDIGANTIAMFY